MACESLARVAEEAGCAVSHPLLDSSFLRALERTGLSAEKLGGRARLIEAVFGEVLPPACVSRRPKATFREVFWRKHSTEFLGSFDTQRLDTAVVDGTALGHDWSSGRPDPRTALLAQHAWLITLRS
jgi:hypothetical protein